jgi:hypothetical protein
VLTWRFSPQVRRSHSADTVAADTVGLVMVPKATTNRKHPPTAAGSTSFGAAHISKAARRDRARERVVERAKGVDLTEDLLIKWGWFLWNCDKLRYPVTWREFELTLRSPQGKWMTAFVIQDINPPPKV